MKPAKNILLLLLLPLLSQCLTEEPQFYFRSYECDFSRETYGWQGDFANYSKPDSSEYRFEFSHTDLPKETGMHSKGLKFSACNKGDRLLMFMTKRISLLEPNTEYTISFDIELFTNSPNIFYSDAIGSPGLDVYLKAGALPIAPNKSLVDDHYTINIDPGVSAADSSNDLVVFSNISNNSGTEDYFMLRRTNASSIKVSSNFKGELWLMIAVDSAYKGTTTLYFTKAHVLLSSN